MFLKSLLLLLPLCNGARESRKQYKSPHSVNLNGLENALSQTSPFDYAYNDELDYNYFPSYDKIDDRGGGDYYTDYDYYYDEDPNHNPDSVFYDSLFGDVDAVMPEQSHLLEESSSISTTSTTPKPLTTSSTTQAPQQRIRPVHTPSHLFSNPKAEEKKGEISNETATTATTLPKLRPINIPAHLAHLITKPKLPKKASTPNKETETKANNSTPSITAPVRLRPLDIPDEFISLPKPTKTQATIKTQLTNIKESLSNSNYSESTTTKPSAAVKKPSKTPLNVFRLKQIMPLVLKQLGLPSSMAKKIFENEEAVNKLVKQLDKMDDFKGLLQHLDLGALASMMSGTDASVALNLLQGSNLGSMTGILKTLGIDTSYIDGIFNRIGAAAAPPSTKAEGDDSKFLYLPLVDSGSVSNVQVIGFVVLLLFLLTTAYAYMEYGLLDATGGTGASYYDTSYTSGDGYDRYTTGGHPAQQSLGWSDGSGLWLPVLESAEADAYYYPGPDPPEDEYHEDYAQPYNDQVDQYEPWRQPEESYIQIQPRPRQPEESYYESHVEDEITYTPKRPSNRYRQRIQRTRRPTTTTTTTTTTTQPPRRITTTTTTQRPRRPTTRTRWGGRFPTEKVRTQIPTDGQSEGRRPASSQNRRVYTTSSQNRRQSVGYRRKAPVVYRYSGNRRYSNDREENYYNPSPPRGGYLKMKPSSVRNSNRRRPGVYNRRYIDEYYDDYEDPDYYEYEVEYDYPDEYYDYYEDDRTETVTEGRASSEKRPYEPLKLNTFNGQANKLSALSEVNLSAVNKESTTASPVTMKPSSTTLLSSSSLSSSTTTKPSSTSAPSTTPNPDIRPTSKIISSIKQHRQREGFTNEHGQDWLRFIHKLAKK